MFDSSVRSGGDYAGVFESDREVSYFYLYRVDSVAGDEILGSIRIVKGKPKFGKKDFDVLWDENENVVALRIRGKIWAAFDVLNMSKYGGDYSLETSSSVPEVVCKLFN